MLRDGWSTGLSYSWLSEGIWCSIWKTQILCDQKVLVWSRGFPLVKGNICLGTGKTEVKSVQRAKRSTCKVRGKEKVFLKKNDIVIARISASRAMQFMMSCATPFDKEWIYVYLANQYMTLENYSLHLLYSKLYAANWRSSPLVNGKPYETAKHGQEDKTAHFRPSPLAAVWRNARWCPAQEVHGRKSRLVTQCFHFCARFYSHYLEAGWLSSSQEELRGERDI